MIQCNVIGVHVRHIRKLQQSRTATVKTTLNLCGNAVWYKVAATASSFANCELVQICKLQKMRDNLTDSNKF